MEPIDPLHAPPPLRPLRQLSEVDDEGARRIFLQTTDATLQKWLLKNSKTVAAVSDDEKNAEGIKVRAKPGKSVRWGVFKAKVYLIGAYFLETRKLDALRPIFPDEPTRRKGTPALEENPFYWVLFHMSRTHREDLSANTRNRISKQLLYAYRHHIPGYAVEGFLSQVREPQEIGKRLEDYEYESWFPKKRRQRKPAAADA